MATVHGTDMSEHYIQDCKLLKRIFIRQQLYMLSVWNAIVSLTTHYWPPYLLTQTRDTLLIVPDVRDGLASQHQVDEALTTPQPHEIHLTQPKNI